jgi:hypothetical protein
MNSNGDWLRRMRDAGFSNEQAEAIARGLDSHHVRRQYLDSRLNAFRDHFDDRMVATREYLDACLDRFAQELIAAVTVRMLGVAGLVILLVGLIDKFVRP